MKRATSDAPSRCSLKISTQALVLVRKFPGRLNVRIRLNFFRHSNSDVCTPRGKLHHLPPNTHCVRFCLCPSQTKDSRQAILEQHSPQILDECFEDLARRHWSRGVRFEAKLVGA